MYARRKAHALARAPQPEPQRKTQGAGWELTGARADPRERYRRLAAFFAEHDLPYEQRFFEDSVRALEKN